MSAGGRTIWWSGTTLHVAAALSLLAATIHLWVVPEHFEEWWGYGTFFVVVALAQGLYALWLLRRPGRPLLLFGVAGNLMIVILWLVTRTSGIPLLGPHAGEVEEVGALDLICTLAEVCVVFGPRSVGDEGPRDGEPHTGRGHPGGVGVALLAPPAPTCWILGPLIPSQSLWDRDRDARL